MLAENVERLPESASRAEVAASIEAACLVGATVFSLEPDFSRCGDAEGALAALPYQSRLTPAVWLGYIPTPERYAAIYEAALAKNIRLVQTLEEHLRAQELDKAYPYLAGLTPETYFATHPGEAAKAIEQLGLPVFVKGAVQSRKARGWKSCVAESATELEAQIEALLTLENRSRGRVAVRRLVPLRYTQTGPNGFPQGREFRVFVWQRSTVLGRGYYWDADDSLATLTPMEEKEILELACEAAERLQVPYIAVDVAQQTDGQWVVIETGDAQFSGLRQTPRLALWQALKDRIDNTL